MKKALLGQPGIVLRCVLARSKTVVLLGPAGGKNEVSFVDPTVCLDLSALLARLRTSAAREVNAETERDE